jgi:hypothetical protein
MAGLDALTEFRAMGVPVGGGVVVAAGQAIADGVGGLGNKIAGAQVGRAAPALAQVVVAWLARFPTVERIVGTSTSDILAMVLVAKALDSMVGISATVRGLLTQVGIPALGYRPAAALGQVRAPLPLLPQRVFRTDVARKATLTRL